MNARSNKVAILCCLGLFGASSLPFDSSVYDRGGILSAVIQPVRMLQREAVAQEANEITPSHVYQATSDLISEIEIMRDAMGVTVYPVEAEPQEDRAPVHVYAKSLEVLEKISAAQKRLGIAPARIEQIPVKEIVAKDVHKSVRNCIAEMRRMKTQLVIEDAIVPAPLEGGKLSSAVYKHLGDASFLLDGLVGHPTDPNDVHTHLVYLHDEMELIAAKLKVALDLEPPAVDGRKRMKEVAQQVLRATFKVINLQTRLGMDASGVPQMTLVRVSPAEVFEATNICWRRWCGSRRISASTCRAWSTLRRGTRSLGTCSRRRCCSSGTWTPWPRRPTATSRARGRYRVDSRRPRGGGQGAVVAASQAREGSCAGAMDRRPHRQAREGSCARLEPETRSGRASLGPDPIPSGRGRRVRCRGASRVRHGAAGQDMTYRHLDFKAAEPGSEDALAGAGADGSWRRWRWAPPPRQRSRVVDRDRDLRPHRAERLHGKRPDAGPRAGETRPLPPPPGGGARRPSFRRRCRRRPPRRHSRRTSRPTDSE